MALTTKEFCKLFPTITKHINSDEVNDLMKLLKHVAVRENEVIIKDNKKNNTLYFVIEGKLDCYIEKGNNKISIGEISPGEYVGEVSMLDDKNATTSVTTITPCTFYTLDKNAFNKLESEHPVVSGKLLRSISSILTSRLISTDRLLFDGLIDNKPSNTDQEYKKNDSNHDWFVKIYNHLHH